MEIVEAHRKGSAGMLKQRDEEYLTGDNHKYRWEKVIDAGQVLAGDESPASGTEGTEVTLVPVSGSGNPCFQDWLSWGGFGDLASAGQRTCAPIESNQRCYSS